MKSTPQTSKQITSYDLETSPFSLIRKKNPKHNTISPIKTNPSVNNKFHLRLKRTKSFSPINLKFQSSKKNDFDIKYFERRIKCEQLKSEILLRDQQNHYSLKNKFETSFIPPNTSFYRKEKISFKYKPTWKYSKDNIFNIKSPITQVFRSPSHYSGSSIKKRTMKIKEKQSDNRWISLKKSRNTDLILKDIMVTPFNNHTTKTLPSTLTKIKQIHMDAFNWNKRWVNTIKKSAWYNDNVREPKKKIKKKKYDFHEACSFAPRERKGIRGIWSEETLIKQNAKRVKLHLDAKTGHYLTQTIKQLLHEDRWLHKNTNDHAEIEFKNTFCKWNKEFKRVTFETIAMKDSLKLDDFYSPKKPTELEKLKKTVNKMKKNWDDVEELSWEVARANIFKSLKLLPGAAKENKFRKKKKLKRKEENED